jgi:hypothetical protein
MPQALPTTVVLVANLYTHKVRHARTVLLLFAVLCPEPS